MLLGEFSISTTSLETSNDSYALDRITGASTRRPFLVAGLGLSALCASFAISFADLLSAEELVLLLLASGLLALLGLSIGQLTLISADLRGSPLAETVFGTYWHLNRLRPQVIAAAARAKKGSVSDGS